MTVLSSVRLRIAGWWVLTGALGVISVGCTDSTGSVETPAPGRATAAAGGSVPVARRGGSGLRLPVTAPQRIAVGSMLRGGIVAPSNASFDVAGVTGEYSGLAWENKLTGEIALWYIHEWQPVEAVRLGSPPPGWKLVAAADFDTDGEGDLLFENVVTGERALWMLWDGGVTTSASLGIVPSAWTIAGAGNADDDGYVDIIWKNVVTGNAAVWYMKKAAVYNAVSLGQPSADYPDLLAIADQNANRAGIPTDRFGVKYFVLVVGNPVTGAMADWVLSDEGIIVAGRTYPVGVPVGSRVGAVGQFNGCSFSDWVVHHQITGEIFYQQDPLTGGAAPPPTSPPPACANGSRVVLGSVDPAVWRLVAAFPVHSPTKGVLVFDANQFPERAWRVTGCISCYAFNATPLPETGLTLVASRPAMFRNLLPGNYRIDLRCQVGFGFDISFCPVGGNSTQTVVVTGGGRTEVAATYYELP